MNEWTNESTTILTIIAPPPILRIANTPMIETEISFARKTFHDEIGEKNTTNHRRGKNENGHPASEEE